GNILGTVNLYEREVLIRGGHGSLQDIARSTRDARAWAGPMQFGQSSRGDRTGGNEIAQNVATLDALYLVWVPYEQQSAAGSQRTNQSRCKASTHHGGLVANHSVDSELPYRRSRVRHRPQ